MKKILFSMLLVMALFVAGCNTDDENNSAVEENFPSKPIELIVGFAPGGANDVAIRIISKNISKYLPNGQEVVIENKPGGGSTIGLTEVYNAKPDGYTIGMASNTGLAIRPHMDDLQYEWDNFNYIMKMAANPQVLFVQKDAEWETFEQWLDYVKENPGEFKYSVPGVASTSHLALAELADVAGIEIEHVPYDGGGPAIQALLGGHVGGAGTFAGNGDESLTNILIDLSEDRSEIWDIPTLREEGIEAGLNAWLGLVAPPDVPEEHLQVIQDAFEKALNDPEVIEEMEKQGLDITYSSPEDFKSEVQDQSDRYKKILQRLGLVE